jgi:hypothetical protein
VCNKGEELNNAAAHRFPTRNNYTLAIQENCDPVLCHKCLDDIWVPPLSLTETNTGSWVFAVACEKTMIRVSRRKPTKSRAFFNKLPKMLRSTQQQIEDI